MIKIQAELARLIQTNNKLTTMEKGQAFLQAWQSNPSEQVDFAQWVMDFNAKATLDNTLKAFFILLAATNPAINQSLKESKAWPVAKLLRHTETETRLLANKTQIAYLKDANTDQLPPDIVLSQLHKELVSEDPDQQFRAEIRIVAILDSKTITANQLKQAVIKIKPTTPAEQDIIKGIVYQQAKLVGKKDLSQTDDSVQCLNIPLTLEDARLNDGEIATVSTVSCDEYNRSVSTDTASTAASSDMAEEDELEMREALHKKPAEWNDKDDQMIDAALHKQNLSPPSSHVVASSMESITSELSIFRKVFASLYRLLREKPLPSNKVIEIESLKEQKISKHI